MRNQLMSRIDGRGNPDCGLCHGDALIFVQDPRTRQARQAVCPCSRELAEAERAALLREMCNVDGETLQRYTFATFHPGKCAAQRGETRQTRQTMIEVKLECEKFAAHPQNWLLLAGNVGSGKSHLAFAIANTLLARGIGVYWETVPELLDALRAGYKDGSYTDRLQMMQRVPVLILDDLGVESSTEWVTEKLFQLINHRYMKAAPTVVTTNLNLDDPDVKLSPRIRSRLLDRSLSTVVRLPAGDYRVPVEG